MSEIYGVKEVIRVVFQVPSGGPEFTTEKKKLQGELIILPEGCTQSNYSNEGTLKTTWDANYFTERMLETAQDAGNYSRSQILHRRRDAENHLEC